MEPDSIIIGALVIILGVVLFAFGLGLGSGSSKGSVVEGCTMQGSFVIDGKVYDCTPRARQ